MDSDEYQRWKDAKKCFIPHCPNTDNNNPNLIFVTIPKELKENWCKIVNRNCPKRTLYCCEEHLNLEEDVEIYGTKKKIKLNATLKNISRPNPIMVMDIDEEQPSTSGHQPIQQYYKYVEVQTQCEVPATYDKSVMAKPNTKQKGTNFKGRKIEKAVDPSSSSAGTESENLPNISSVFDSTSSTNPQILEKYRQKAMIDMIEKKPKMYLGLPKNWYWVINYIAKEYALSSLHIIITLFKLKNNDTFNRISDEFEISRTTLNDLFKKNVTMIASFFQNLIFLPSPYEIKRNLPLVFKVRYSNVQIIIDCFEIEIQKPSNPIRQVQTWSQYKSANTIKYLIGCTPNGFVAFISQGVGGRTSDKAITEWSGFLDILPLNAVIMADRGFKEIESVLIKKNIRLLRPPSVQSNKKMTKEEAIEAKVIASLRVHIERVIRRVREFQMLKLHSVIYHKHLKYLDELVIIACGLINLQEQIIKEY